MTLNPLRLPPPPRNKGVTGAPRVAAVFLAGLALSAPFAEAQTVSITSTPNNGTHYVAGEAITARISGLSSAI